MNNKELTYEITRIVNRYIDNTEILNKENMMKEIEEVINLYINKHNEKKF